MKIYKANRKGYIRYVLIGFLLLPIIIMFLDKDVLNDKPYVLLILLLPALLIGWIYLDTYYKIEGDKLIYHSGFIRGNIEIQKIKEIIKGKTLWVGIKPALATKGLIIKFNSYDEIYIAPESNEELTADLLKIKSNINIIQ